MFFFFRMNWQWVWKPGFFMSFISLSNRIKISKALNWLSYAPRIPHYCQLWYPGGGHCYIVPATQHLIYQGLLWHK